MNLNKNNQKLEKLEMLYWPLLSPVRFFVYVWLFIGGLLYKLNNKFRDWTIEKTI